MFDNRSDDMDANSAQIRIARAEKVLTPSTSKWRDLGAVASLSRTRLRRLSKCFFRRRRAGWQPDYRPTRFPKCGAYFAVMLLTPRSFVRFLDGRLGPTQRIAFVPGEYTRQIGTLQSDLLIDREYALKLQRKHRLRYEHFEMIQPTIDRGYAVIDGGGNLVFVYDDQERFHGIFRLAVKANRSGTELWLRTFHRIKVAQLNSLVRRWRLVKDHEYIEQEHE